MQFKKLGAVLLLFLFTVTAANAFLVDGFEEQGINRTFEDDSVRFTADYLNLSIPYKNATYPDELHPGLKAWTYSTTVKENSTQLDFQSEWEKTNDTAPNVLTGRKINGKLDVKKGKTKGTLYDGEYVDDVDNVSVTATASTHRNHLIIEYSVEADVSAANGTTRRTFETYRDIYSDDPLDKLPVFGEAQALPGNRQQHTVTVDRLHTSERDWKQLFLVHEPGTTITDVDFGGNQYKTCDMDYENDVTPELDAAGITDYRVDNITQYKTACYNVSIPADTEQELTVTYTESDTDGVFSMNNDYEYYGYVLGSAASYTVSSQSDWDAGTFNDTIASSGTLELASAGTPATVNTTLADASSGSTSGVTFSPNGKYLGFTGYRQNHESYIYWVSNWTNTVTLSGSDVRKEAEWSPDSKLYAFTDANADNARVFNVGGGWSQNTTLDGGTHRHEVIGWSGDGQYLGYGGHNNDVQVVNSGTWGSVTTLNSATSTLNTLTWSNDGAWVALSGGNDGNLHVHQTSDWSEIQTISETGGLANFAQFSPNDNYILSIDGSNTVVYVHETSDWNKSASFDEPSSTMIGGAWSPDESLFAYGNGSDVVVRRTSDWGVETTLDVFDSNDVRNMHWHPDGDYFAVGESNAPADVVIYNTEGGTRGSWISPVQRLGAGGEALDNIEVDVASLPANSDIDMVVEGLDGDNVTQETEVLDVNTAGVNNYSTSIGKYQNWKFTVNMSNGDDAPKVNGFTVYSDDVPAPNMTLNSPANASSVSNPVDHDFTPAWYTSWVDRAELWIEGTRNKTQNWVTNDGSEWDSGSFNSTSSSGGELSIQGGMQTDYGYFQSPSSTGTKTITTGFEPDLVVFRVTSTNENFDTDTSYGGREWGWGHGFADCTQDPCNEVALTVGSGSSSTNGQATAGSSSHSIYQVITPNDGNGIQGYISASVSDTSSSGFTVNFDAVQQQNYVTYKAYDFGTDNVDVGYFSNPTSTGTKSVSTGFQPNFVALASTPRLTTMDNSVQDGNDNGWALGWAAENSTHIMERAMGVSMYSNNIDDHVFTSSDSQVLDLLHQQSKGGITDRVDASLQSFTSNGFDLDFTSVSEGEISIYAAVGADATPEVGHTTTPTSTGTQTVQTNGELDDVSFAMSNTISGIDVEGTSGGNNGDNHHGWMFGMGNTTRATQRAMGFSSHSNSVNGHHAGSRANEALHLLYSDANGNKLGSDTGYVSSITDGSFDIEWTNIVTSSTTNVKYNSVLVTYWGFDSEPKDRGSYESRFENVTNNGTGYWDSVSFSEDVPSGASTEYEYSDNGNDWYTSLSDVPTGNGLKYRINLTANGNGESPSVDWVNVTYNASASRWEKQDTLTSGLKNDSVATITNDYLTFTQNTPWDTFTQGDWNEGSHNGTSADRDNNSGQLGIGYVNDTFSSNLAGFWRLDRTSGDAQDYSGNSHHGTVQNSVSRGSEGVFGTNAFTFDSSDDDDVEISHDSQLSISDTVTVAAWVKTTDGGDEGFVSKANSGESNMVEYSLMMGACGASKGVVQMTTADSGGATCGNNLVSTSNTYNDGNWHLFVGTRDASTGNVSIYVDGELKNSITGDTNNPSDTGDVHIGVRHNGNGRASADIDEAMILDKTLSPSEVKELYRWGRDGTFNGNYTSKTFDAEQSATWKTLDTTSTVPANTDAWAEVEVSDDNFATVKDNDVFKLSGGTTSHSVNVQDAQYARVNVNGTSTDETSTWTVSSVNLTHDTATGYPYTLPQTFTWNVKLYDRFGVTATNTNNWTVTVSEDQVTVSNLNVDPDPIGMDFTTNLTADAESQDGSIDTVQANVTSPDGESRLLDMALDSGITYIKELLPEISAANIGEWEFEAIANDTAGNENSENMSFTVVSKWNYTGTFANTTDTNHDLQIKLSEIQ